jgi:hypothetical protein
MLSRRERARVSARETLQTLTPAPPDNSSLLKAEEEATAVIEEARRSGISSSDLAASLLCEVSQGYDRYLVQRRARKPKG